MVRFMFYKVLSGHSVENTLCGRKGELRGAVEIQNRKIIAESKKEIIMAWSVSADKGKWTHLKDI